MIRNFAWSLLIAGYKCKTFKGAWKYSTNKTVVYERNLGDKAFNIATTMAKQNQVKLHIKKLLKQSIEIVTIQM